jgi:hypothetical protein
MVLSSIYSAIGCCSNSRVWTQKSPEAGFLDEIQSTVLRVFLLVIHITFFKLTQPLTVSVNEKGGKPYRKPYPLPYRFRNPYRNLKSENSKGKDYAQKPQ